MAPFLPLVALLCAAPVQDLPSAPAAPPDDLARLEFNLGDGVVAVVGRQLVRRSDLLFALQDPRFRQRIDGIDDLIRKQTPEAQEQALFLVLRELVRDLLMTEGGRNQGYDPELVARFVEGNVERTERMLGGPVALAAAWAEVGLTPESFRLQRERQMLGRTWEDAVTGRGLGPGGRQTVDRYVRPGLLQEEYRSRLESPSAKLQETIGIQPERLALQQVVLGYEAYSREDAERIAAQIATEVESGALDMRQAVLNFTLPERHRRDWEIEPMTREQVGQYSRLHYGDGSMEEVVLALNPGDVAPPIVVNLARRDGTRAPYALVVYRLAEIQPARSATEFETSALQRSLEGITLEELDEYRLERGLRDLLEITYVYPIELKRQLLGAPATGDERLR